MYVRCYYGLFSLLSCLQGRFHEDYLQHCKIESRTCSGDLNQLRSHKLHVHKPGGYPCCEKTYNPDDYCNNKTANHKSCKP